MSHPDSPKQAFIVVSTEQNLANLPPVLECAKAGDVVLWVESDLARKAQWNHGARQILEAHGLVNHPVPVAVQVINDPFHIAQHLTPVVATLAPDHRLNLVMNGGQKLTPLGLQTLAVESPRLCLSDKSTGAKMTFFDHFSGTDSFGPLQIDDIWQESTHEQRR